jgi:hypothetical protein
MATVSKTFYSGSLDPPFFGAGALFGILRFFFSVSTLFCLVLLVFVSNLYEADFLLEAEEALASSSFLRLLGLALVSFRLTGL